MMGLRKAGFLASAFIFLFVVWFGEVQGSSECTRCCQIRWGPGTSCDGTWEGWGWCWDESCYRWGDQDCNPDCSGGSVSDCIANCDPSQPCYCVIHEDPDPDPDPVCGCGDCNQACSGASYTGLCGETCGGCKTCGNICDGGFHVLVYVFDDTNENGKWDDGEEGINLGAGDPRVAGAKLEWTSGSPCSSGKGSMTENDYIVGNYRGSEDEHKNPPPASQEDCKWDDFSECSDERDGVKASCYLDCSGGKHVCIPATIESQSFGNSFDECSLIRHDWCGATNCVNCVMFGGGDKYNSSGVLQINEKWWLTPPVPYDYVGKYWHRVLRHGGGNTFRFSLDMDDNPDYEATTGTVSQFFDGGERQLIALGIASNCSNPDCPTNLSVNPQCGATVSKATFSWQSIYDESLVLPSKWVLRVDRDDIPPFYPNAGYAEGTGPPENRVKEWMTAHDYWRYATSSPVSPNDISSCAWDFGGAVPVLKCSATLDSTTLSKGGYPFTPGHYNWWSIQAVNDCDSYDGQCSVQAPGFDCVNQAPTCTPILGPNEVLYGDTSTYSSTVNDSLDPVQYSWAAAVNCDIYRNFPPFIPWRNFPYIASGPLWLDNDLYPANGSGDKALLPKSVSTDHYVRPGTFLVSEFGLVYECSYERNSSTTVRLAVSDTSLQSYCSKAVTLRHPTIKGTIYDATENLCRDISEPLPYLVFGADLSFRAAVDSPNDNISVGVNKDTGVYNFSTTYSVGSNLGSIYLEEGDFNTPLDTTFEIKCVETACTHDFDPDALPSDCTVAETDPAVLRPSFKSLSAVGAYPIPGDITVDLGYKLVSTLNGWFTVLNGSIYSGSGFDMVTPQELGSYAPYLTNSFALSSGSTDLVVRDKTLSERIVPESGSGGYGYIIDPINLAVQASDLPANDDLELISSLSDLDPSEVYYIDSNDLNDVLSGGDVEYSSSAIWDGSDGVVVIKTEGNISFTHNFYSADRNKKILFVTDEAVIFDETFGVDNPSGGGIDDSRIDVGIFTLDDINFPGSGEEEGDMTLVINGILISGGNVNFNRNRELKNKWPGVAVHFDPSYAYYLQKQMRADPSYAEKIMSIVDISWDIKD